VDGGGSGGGGIVGNDAVRGLTIELYFGRDEDDGLELDVTEVGDAVIG